MAADPADSESALAIALLTVADSHTPEVDAAAQAIAARIAAAGHCLSERRDVPDSSEEIVSHLHRWIDDPEIAVVITIGGTGLTGRAVTPEALALVGTKAIPGFGELFRWLSFRRIGTSAIQSRACAVLARGTYVFALPASVEGVCQAWDEILSEQLDSEHDAENLVSLRPRLQER